MLGKTINSRGSAIKNPPITEIANGWCNSAPAPIPSANGISAMIAPRAVISLGRNLVEIEYTIDSSTDCVCNDSLNCKKVKMAFSPIMPTIIINPV